MILCLSEKYCDIVVDMNKKGGSKCCKSVAMLLVLCVVLVGCSGSSDQTGATVLPAQQATTTAGMADAFAGSTVASSGEAEVVESARTSPSSVPAASSADVSEEADLPDSTTSTSAVIPPSTTVASSSTVDDERLRAWQDLSGFIAKALSGNASQEEFNEIMARFTYDDESEKEAVIQQSAEAEETPTGEATEETGAEDECQTPATDTTEATNNTVLTDVIHGMIISSEDGEPLRLDFVDVQTYPGFWAPFDVYYEFEILFVLNIELRDAAGRTVYCAPFSVRPSSNGNFWVRIPNPPDYDRIAIVNSGEDVGEVWRSQNTPIVEDLTPEHGSIFCYDDVIKGMEYIRVKWKNVDRDHYTLPFSSPFHYKLANRIWISTDGGLTYKLIWRGTAERYTFHPADFYDARDVYVRVHISDSTRTSYTETYFKLDPNACSSEQQPFQRDEETSPERQDQEISAETECELPRLNQEDEQNEEKLNHTIDAKVYLSRQNDPIGLSFFQVEVLAVPRLPSEPSAGHNRRRGTIEFRDASGQAVVSSEYIVFWPWADYFPSEYYGEIYTRTPYNTGYFVSGSIPDPSEYESIAVLYAGEEIGVFHKSANSPVVEIVNPGCGEVYQRGDSIRMTWYGYDLDGDDLDYEVWYSTDERESYRRTHLKDDYTFSPHISFQQEDFSGRVYVRVHATDGFLTDYDETYFEIVQDE